MKWHIFILLIVLVSASRAVPVKAKGSFAALRVRGGELAEEIEITEPSLLDFFSFSEFPVTRLQEAPVNAPALLDKGYEITRLMLDERNGELVVFDRLFFVPGESESSGLVYYQGIIDGSSEYDQAWYVADAQAGAALERAIAQQIDPVGNFLEERRGWITLLGALLGLTALARWAWERWIQPRQEKSG